MSKQQNRTVNKSVSRCKCNFWITQKQKRRSLFFFFKETSFLVTERSQNLTSAEPEPEQALVQMLFTFRNLSHFSWITGGWETFSSPLRCQQFVSNFIQLSTTTTDFLSFCLRCAVNKLLVLAAGDGAAWFLFATSHPSGGSGLRWACLCGGTWCWSHSLCTDTPPGCSGTFGPCRRFSRWS